MNQKFDNWRIFFGKEKVIIRGNCGIESINSKL